MHDEQSRTQLQLALASGYGFDATRKLFEAEICNVVYTPATDYYNATSL